MTHIRDHTTPVQQYQFCTHAWHLTRNDLRQGICLIYDITLTAKLNCAQDGSFFQTNPGWLQKEIGLSAFSAPYHMGQYGRSWVATQY
jgi:hypothetical protein